MSSPDPIASYLAELRRVLGGRWGLRRRLLHEAEAHLRESAAAMCRDGVEPAEAARAAIARFGEPDEVARALVGVRARPVRAVAIGIAGAAIASTVALAVADRGHPPSGRADAAPPPAVASPGSGGKGHNANAPAVASSGIAVVPPAAGAPAPPAAEPTGEIVPVADSAPLTEAVLGVLREPQLVPLARIRKATRWSVTPDNVLYLRRARVALSGAGSGGKREVLVVPSRRRSVLVSAGSSLFRSWRLPGGRTGISADVPISANGGVVTTASPCTGNVRIETAGVFGDSVRDLRVVVAGRTFPVVLGQNGYFSDLRFNDPSLCKSIVGPDGETIIGLAPPQVEALIVALEDGRTVVVPVTCGEADAALACPQPEEIPDRWSWPVEVPGDPITWSLGSIPAAVVPGGSTAADLTTARLLVSAGRGDAREDVYAARSLDGTKLCLFGVSDGVGGYCIGDRANGRVLRPRGALQLFATRAADRRITIAGVARSDVTRVVVLRNDGLEVPLPLNRWRGFGYSAPAGPQAPLAIRAFTADGTRIYERAQPWLKGCPPPARRLPCPNLPPAPVPIVPPEPASGPPPPPEPVSPPRVPAPPPPPPAPPPPFPAPAAPPPPAAAGPNLALVEAVVLPAGERLARDRASIVDIRTDRPLLDIVIANTGSSLAPDARLVVRVGRVPLHPRAGGRQLVDVSLGALAPDGIRHVSVPLLALRELPRGAPLVVRVDVHAAEGESYVEDNRRSFPLFVPGADGGARARPIPPGPPLELGDRGLRVRRTQAALIALALLAPGDTSGRYDRKTRVAVQAFQLANGLEASGVLDAGTRRTVNDAVRGGVTFAQ